MATVRIVSATVHHDTNEVEIIVEREGEDTGINFFREDDTLHTMWVDASEVVKKGQKWVKP